MPRASTVAFAVAGLLACGLGSASALAAPAGAAKVDLIANDVINRLVTVTDEHFHKGEYCHVVNVSRAIVAGDPHNLDIYANAGWLLWSMDRDDDAVALYKQGLAANPDSYYMYDELGQYYFNRKKDWPTAISYYEKAAAFKNCPAFTIHMLAHAYERNNQLGLALGMWQRAQDMPNNASVQMNMDRVRAKLKAQPEPPEKGTQP